MGPFVPDIISNEMNLVVALILGVGFGFALEQAGFSSSRKLTGLFYGTDFTVLRVFFTAGATAMTGVLLLSEAGLLDTSVIFVNPTFVHSAIVGGLIMGVGFVVGGFCPGTSFCAAAVGRIDGMVFVLGGLIGVFVFGEAFPHVQALYLAGSFGDITVPAALGISPGLFGLLLSAVAVAAFALTTKLERHVNPASTSCAFPVRPHRLGAAVLLGAALVAMLMPGYRTRLLARAADTAYRSAQPIAQITADELAFRILDRDASLVLIDTRPAADFAKSGLPGAVNIPLAEMFGSTWRDVLSRGGHKIFIGQREEEGRTAASLALQLGYRDVGVLRGGQMAFATTILAASAASDGAAGMNDETALFRADAGVKIAALIKARGAAPVKRVGEEHLRAELRREPDAPPGTCVGHHASRGPAAAAPVTRRTGAGGGPCGGRPTGARRQATTCRRAGAPDGRGSPGAWRSDSGASPGVRRPRRIHRAACRPHTGRSPGRWEARAASARAGRGQPT